MGTKITIILCSIFLSSEVSESFLPNLGEKLTIIAALAFFLYYFMKELKEVRSQMEKSRTEHEEKMEKMFDRVVTIERESQEAIIKSNFANEKLADAIDDLTQKIHQIRS